MEVFGYLGPAEIVTVLATIKHLIPVGDLQFITRYPGSGTQSELPAWEGAGTTCLSSNRRSPAEVALAFLKRDISPRNGRNDGGRYMRKLRHLCKSGREGSNIKKEKIKDNAILYSS